MLVFSHACFKRVNRSVFQVLADNESWNIEICAPKSLRRGANIDSPDEPKDGDVPIHFLPLKRHNPRLYWFLGTIELLQKSKPNIIYLDNDPVSLQAYRLGKWCKRNNVKLICLSCENLSFQFSRAYQRGGLKTALLATAKTLVSSFTKRYVDHLFVVNNAGLEIYKNLGFKSVSKTPLGFDSNLFYRNPEARTKVRRKTNVKDHQVLIAYIGRIVPEKGVHVLLAALDTIKEYDWVFMLDEFKQTSTNYLHELKKQIENSWVSNRVKFFDADHGEIGEYMNAADIVVIPSVPSMKWIEQYGRVAPEAMACGTLVVASNTGALPELIEDGGVLFESGSVSALRTILIKYFNAPDAFSPVIDKGHKKAHAKLNIQAQSDQIKKVVQSFK